jgi:hypothetical protein
MRDIAIQTDGSIYLGGNYRGAVDLDPGAGVYTPSDARGGMIVKLNSSGNLNWVRVLGANTGTVAERLDVDSLGNVYTAGWFSLTADLDPGSGVYEVTSAGDLDAFAAKLTASGDFAWAAPLYGESRQLGYGLGVNSQGTVVLGGYSTDGSLDLDPTDGTHVVSSEAVAMFVVTLSQPLPPPPPPPTLTVNSVSKNEGRNGTTAFVFTVTLSEASSQMISVNYATADGTATLSGNDYAAAVGTLIFNPGETTKTITVLVKGDRSKEADESFFVNLLDAVNADILFGTGTGWILNDD